MRVARQTLPRSLEEEPAGEWGGVGTWGWGRVGAANLRIFTGQKVEHNVSTDSGAHRQPCQATDRGEHVRRVEEGQSQAKNGIVYSRKAVMVSDARAKSTLTSRKKPRTII